MTELGLLNILVRLRMAIRGNTKAVARWRHEQDDLKAQSKAMKETGNRFIAKRAEPLDARIELLGQACSESFESLARLGDALMGFSELIDATISRDTLMSFLEINVADRGKLQPSDGFVKMAYVYGLESSAMYRKSDWKQGPFNHAITTCFQHKLLHDKEYADMIHEGMFGKGSMFEFLPTYTRTPEGEFIKKRPKLRLADPEVDKAKAA